MRKRLVSAKVLTVFVIALALTSRHVYGEDSLLYLLLNLSGLALVISSAVGRIWTSAYISGLKNTTLMTFGPYSIVRNPLYFFSFFGFIGAGMMFGSVFLAACLAVVFFCTHWPTILKEEKKLRLAFGDQFDQYCAATPRFIPSSLKLRAPDTLVFKPAQFTHAVAESLLIFLVIPCQYLIQWAQLNAILPVIFVLP